tara:strand:+ start:15988 stop:16821 length:834 start_codon:yes stop_codon:yes gene_type:complete
MHFLRKILDFYIFSNIHVALAGFCLTKITLLKFGISGDLTSVFVALSIIISYNFIRFFEIEFKRLNWFKNWFFEHKIYIITVSVLAVFFIGIILFSNNFNLNALIILFPFAFMTLFYVVPLFKIGNIEISFRNFPLIKIFSIAIAWAGITVFFPLFEANYEFTSSVYLEFIQRVLILISITLPFDIRDVEVDPKSLKTLPQVFGVEKSKIIGYISLLGVICLEFFKKEFSNFNIYIAIVLVIAVFLRFSSAKKNRYYTSFWVEAIPIFWFVLMLLFF